MTDLQLMELVPFWQKQLRLQDWNVHVKFVPACELPKGKIGTCQSILLNKEARIQIMNVESYAALMGGSTEGYDPEDILVHELFHIHFAFMDEFEPKPWNLYEIGLEQAFESITPALLKFKREAQGKTKTTNGTNPVPKQRAKTGSRSRQGRQPKRDSSRTSGNSKTEVRTDRTSTH